jgi:uracil-DNA glycosylase
MSAFMPIDLKKNHKKIFDDIDQIYIEKIILRNTSIGSDPENNPSPITAIKLFRDAVNQVNARFNRNGMSVYPRDVDLLNAFKLCKWNDLKVVIIGQDPYPGDGLATGLAFEINGQLPARNSLRIMFNCLKKQGLITEIPRNGRLSSWARQGVLLINSVWTVQQGEANTHKDIWSKYFNVFLTNLCAVAKEEGKHLVFLLLGNAARTYAPIISGFDHLIFDWGHPSPMSARNKQPTHPENFLNCDIFGKTNDALINMGLQPINWNSINGVPSPINGNQENTSDNIGGFHNPMVEMLNPFKVVNTILLEPLTNFTFISTDGGFKKSMNNRGVSAFICSTIDDSGRLNIYNRWSRSTENTTNQRAELLALLEALKYAEQNVLPKNKLIIVSDSSYGVLTLNLYIHNWERDGVVNEKENLDLILPAFELYKILKDRYDAKLLHIPGHRDKELHLCKDGSFEKYAIEMNIETDKQCNNHVD